MVRRERLSRVGIDVRRLAAVAGYLLLLALTFYTVSDRRLRIFASLVLLLFLVLTVFHERSEAPSVQRRPVDLGHDEQDEHLPPAL